MKKQLFVFLAVVSLIQAKTEVVLISSEHFLTDQIGDTGPAYIRAMLQKVRPQVLALEAPSNVPDPFAQLPFEAWNVTKPWAEKNHIPVRAVDWIAPDYHQRLGQLVQNLTTGPHAKEFAALEEGLQAKLAGLRGFETMQQELYHDACRNYWAKIREWSASPTAWDERGKNIASNLERLAAEFDGQRIAVVFGAMHGHDLADRLAKSAFIKLVSTSQFLPLKPEELVAASLPEDTVLAMRRLNFPPGAPIVGKLEGIDSALKRLEKTPGMKPTASYYLARLLMHRGQWKAADALLEKISQLPSDVQIQIPNHPPLALTARYNRAIALNILGEKSKAGEELDKVLSDKATPADIRQLTEQLRKSL